MMRFLTIFIIIFSITGTVWSMWLSNELKNEELKLKIVKNKIIEIDEKIRLVDAEWSYLTNAKNIEFLNNKYLKLKPLPLKDISFIKSKNTITSKNIDNINPILKEIN
ncbi:MAG: hypothetical protein CFH33_00251 [Alphaproteobacteria bacterium MarineAlpha9_Bin3]|nr:MAG: hypothetical protein CFH33_00251 [Alphaproteobacteria bacterium MarineAlpha9_Bin3]|tara:strand:+ start:7206 stop:7529 length:324 start_codon:yes stop_codon:yes gene_type:complete